MKASSESGECASLISRVSVVVFEVAWPVMGWSFLCAAAPDCCLPYPKPRREIRLSLKETIEAETETRGRERCQGLRGTCCVLQRKPSTTPPVATNLLGS